MMIDPALKRAIAVGVHTAVAEFDRADAGLWRCKDYAVAGADLLRLLTDGHYEAVGGFSGVNTDALPAIPITHASGVPLSARPTWADSVQIDEPAHAWIQNCTDIIDFSVRPILWGPPAALGEHWFSPDASYTRTLRTLHTPNVVANITHRAIELAGPVWLSHHPINDAARLLERIASRWPTLAETLAAGYVRQP